MNFLRKTTLLGVLVPVLGLASNPLLFAEEKAATTLYVSTGGNDAGAGSREEPLATVQSALSRLPETSGTIALLSGRYTEAVVLPSRGGPGNLTLCAAPGEEVTFDGSAEAAGWEPWNSVPGLYRIPVPPKEPHLNLNLWEDGNRVRYQKQIDPRGVRAWPGSFCVLGSGHLLVHTRDGRDPETLHLRMSRTPVAIRVERSEVAIRNLHFKNYLGDKYAAAIVLLASRKDLQVSECEMTNMVRGLVIQSRAEHVEVTRCRLSDVGTGVFNLGYDVNVRDCVIQAAVGAFAIEQEINLYEHDGLRFYHPAQGGEISGCVTAGFWAGLYLKTGEAVEYGGEQARPFVISHNTFTDGVKRGSGSQALDRYIGNVIAGGRSTMNSLQAVGAALESNYFFSEQSLPATPVEKVGSNKVGPPPFTDLARGDLAIRAGLAFPVSSGDGRPAGAEARQVRWMPGVAALFGPAPGAGAEEGQQALAPKWAGSIHGAIVTVRLPVTAAGVLRYRAVKENAWREARAISNDLSSPAAISDIAGEPDEDPTEKPSDLSVAFVLSGGLLRPETEYEFRVEASGAGKKTIRSESQRFITHGGPKEIHVSAEAETKGADGSREHPFARLQPAFDHALPGDTIFLEKGVYTSPAILSHGGTEALPIVIRGSGENETILDGGGVAPAVLELRGAEHVFIRDLQVRWFGKAGIAAHESRRVSIERCRFLNREMTSSEYPNGSGILLKSSPGSTIAHCTFARLVYGFQAIDSPQVAIRNNTAFKNLYAAGNLVRSSRGSLVTENSFTFANVASLIIREPDDSAFGSLVCDFNNYATVIGNTVVNKEKLRPENDFQPAERYGKLSTSKRIIDRIHSDGNNRLRFYRMEDWARNSGKDRHSIFADPQYADPLKGDFRLLPGSPNVLEGAGGKQQVIGAAPVLEAAANPAR